MQTGTERAQPHLKSFYVVASVLCLIQLIVLICILWNFNNLKTNITNNKVAGSIVISVEDESFVKTVCRDLGLEGEVVILVGPYYVPSFFSSQQNYTLERLLTRYPVIVDPTDPTRKIFMKKSIYPELTIEEKKGLLAHEIWHIYSYIRNGYMPKPDIYSAIEADRFATRYVNPEVLINLYRKYGDGGRVVQILISELEKQKIITTYLNSLP